MKKLALATAALALFATGAVASPLTRSTISSESGETQAASDNGGFVQFLFRSAQTSIVLLLAKAKQTEKNMFEESCETIEAEDVAKRDDDMDGPEPVYFAF